jgi:tetratricopeptide (TPR) repeat protein
MQAMISLTGAAVSLYGLRPAQQCLERGRKRQRQGDYQGALADYTQALHLDPRLCQGYQERAQIQFHLDNPEAALRDLCLARRYDATGYSDLTRAHIHQHLDETEAAIEALTQALNKHMSLTLLWQRAELYKKQGCWLDAIADLTQILTLDPSYWLAYQDRAQLFILSGNISAAITDYSRLIAQYPNPELYYQRGVLYYHSDQWVESLADFNQVLNLDPSHVAAYFYRGNLYFELGEFQIAFQDYDHALHLDPLEVDLMPEDEYGFYARALAQIHLGDPEAAVADLHRSQELSTQHHHSLLTLPIQIQLRKFQDRHQNTLKKVSVDPT